MISLLLFYFFPILGGIVVIFAFWKWLFELPNDIAKIIVFFIKKWQDILLYIALIIGGFLLVVLYNIWKNA